MSNESKDRASEGQAPKHTPGPLDTQCVVCGEMASHNLGGVALVCVTCCPGCGKAGRDRMMAQEAFDRAIGQPRQRHAPSAPELRAAGEEMARRFRELSHHVHRTKNHQQWSAWSDCGQADCVADRAIEVRWLEAMKP